MNFAGVSDAASHARYVLGDSQAPLRFADDMLWTAAYYALHDMERLRPDLFLDWVLPSTVSGTASLAQLDSRYHAALVDYICYWIEQQDEESTDNSRALNHYRAYVGKMTGVQA